LAATAERLAKGYSSLALVSGRGHKQPVAIIPAQGLQWVDLGICNASATNFRFQAISGTYSASYIRDDLFSVRPVAAIWR